MYVPRNVNVARIRPGTAVVAGPATQDNRKAYFTEM